MLNIRNRDQHIWTHTQWVKYISKTYVSRSAASTSKLLKKRPRSFLLPSSKSISIMLTKSALVTVPLSSTPITQRTQDTGWSISGFFSQRPDTLSDHHTHTQACGYWIFGRGLRISFPVSSQDMLYSAKTVRQRAAIIDGATTRLCIPAKKRAMRVMQLMVKKGWFHSDEKKETFCVSGSINQFQAPVAVQTDTTIKITEIRQEN